MDRRFKQAMETVRMSEECRARIRGALEERSQLQGQPAGRTVRKRARLVVVIAVMLLLLIGSALAAAYRAGVLEVFFHGDTSELEPYVYNSVDSTEDENYRLTVDSLRDGDGLYVIITVEALTEQAAEALNNIALGPDTFLFTSGMTKGWWLSEEETFSETSRSFSIETNLTQAALESLEPIILSADFMAEGCEVCLPIDRSMPTVSRTIQEEVLVNPLTGNTEFWEEVSIASTRFTYVSQSDQIKPHAGAAKNAADPLIFLKMKDGTVLTRSQLGLSHVGGESIVVEPKVPGKRTDRCFEGFDIAIDPTQVESLIVGGREFPMDGSAPREIELEREWFPFFTEHMQYGEDRDAYVASMKDLCEKLGAEYTWDGETKTATGVYRGVTLSLTADSCIADVDGTPMEIAPRYGKSYKSYPAVQNGDTIAAHWSIFDTVWDIELWEDRVENELTSSSGWRWVVIP